MYVRPPECVGGVQKSWSKVIGAVFFLLFKGRINQIVLLVDFVLLHFVFGPCHSFGVFSRFLGFCDSA